MGNWIERKNTELINVKTRSQGTDLNAGVPCLKVEHYFPNISDPEIILKAYNEDRPLWDK